MNRTVRRPVLASNARAFSMISRTSLTDAEAAFRPWNSQSAWRATTRASVVFPVPGGP
jgi:hypothetical protein